MAGVDMRTNPLFLPEDRLAAATNMAFHEGNIQSRPGILYHDLGASGQFQGACVYSPSRGLSHQPFADPYTALVIAAGGKLTYNLSIDGLFEDCVTVSGALDLCNGDIHLYQAENYLIGQAPGKDTFWWEGYGTYTISPGLDASPDVVGSLLAEAELRVKTLPGANIDCCFQKIDYCSVDPIDLPEELFSSHDTLVFANHRNFLINSAGVGIYTNGRIHQESPTGIFISDLIHKRGTRFTDDILLMEEQQAGSFGDPLSTNSKLGQLRALEVLPRMNTANGEGVLVAYYDNGVVSFDTFAVPRETRMSPEGEMLQKGWSEIRQVDHLLSRISATGRYAVCALPRDNAFRSRFGIHLLKTSIGEDRVFSDEYINTLAQDVQPILDADPKSSLRGVTIGQWVEGSRLLTSVGMVSNRLFTSSTMGRGFVVWNQATTYTEDRTPRPLWEGLWSVHSDIAGIHRLLDSTEVNGDNMFGFVASRKNDAGIVFGEIDAKRTSDCFSGEEVSIEWSVTSRKVFGGFSTIRKLTDGRLEIEACGVGSKARVMVRTDTSPKWVEWASFDTSDTKATELFSFNLGQPPQPCREASWFQFKVEGIGWSAVRLLEAEIVDDRTKMNRSITTKDADEAPENFHYINQSPPTKRWS